MIDWLLLLEWIIKSVIIIGALLTGFAYMTWTERKFAALLQQRHGPNRAGPFGLLLPVADGIKLMFKEELIPAGADRFVFLLAPIVTVVPALVILAVVPWGPTVTIFGRQVMLGLADLNVGLLYFLAIASIAVYGVALAGWSSNNKYTLLGGLRSAAQMVSYELSMGLSVMGPLDVDRLHEPECHSQPAAENSVADTLAAGGGAGVLHLYASRSESGAV